MASSGVAAAKNKQASDEIKKKNQMIASQEAEDEAWFNKQYYQDITKRTDVMNMLRKADEQQKKQQTANDAKAAIMGATDESKIAAQDSLNKAYGDTVANIASNASALKDSYLSDWRNRKNNYYLQRLGMQDELAAIKQNESNQWSQAGVNAFSGGASLLASGLGGLNGLGSTNKSGMGEYSKGASSINPMYFNDLANGTYSGLNRINI